MALLLNNNEKEAISYPPIYKSNKLDGGKFIDFRDIFVACAEDILCTKYSSKKVLNLDIVNRNTDYYIKSEEEIRVLSKLLDGQYEGTCDRTELIEVMLRIWNKSSNFRSMAEGVIKSLEHMENTEDMADRLRIFPNLKNALPVSNLREYIRFRMYEIYVPIRNYLLNKCIQVCDSRVYYTPYPLIYLMKVDEIPEISIMVGNNLYYTKIIDNESPELLNINMDWGEIDTRVLSANIL